LGSEPNVEVVRSWLGAVNDPEVGKEFCGPEMRIDNIAEFPITGPYLGHDGLVQWKQDLAEVIDEFDLDVEELLAVDDERVLAILRLRGRFVATGIPIDAPWGAIIRVEDGLVTHATGYGTPNQARKAANA